MPTTKLQQTIVGDNNSFADFKGWAGDISASPGTGTGIAAALYTLGFTKLNDTYTSNWTNGTTNDGLSNPNSKPLAGGNLFGATFPATAANARAQLPGANFLGAWSGGTAYTVGQVVTYTPASGGQQCYICWAAGGIGVPPASNASSQTYWAPYWMEIWSMVAAGLSTVYIKLEYGGGATAANPQLSIQFGSAYVTNSGVLSGNVSTVEQCFVGTGVATISECDWSGDGQNYFGMFMHRANGTHAAFLCFERGISGQTNGAPVYSTTNQYITYLVGIPSTTWHQCSLFLGTGLVNVTSNRLAYGAAVLLFVAGTQVINNITPALPVFPLVGWCGNPLSVMQAYSVTDTVEGVVVTSTVYGTATNYLTSINALYVKSLGGTANIYGIGLKWM